MRAVLIDPALHLVKEVETDGQLASLQSVVGGMITGIYPGSFIGALRGAHGYVDDEGLWNKQDHVHGAFAIGPYDYLRGRAILLGSTASGNETDCPVGAEVVARFVRWITPLVQDEYLPLADERPVG